MDFAKTIILGLILLFGAVAANAQQTVFVPNCTGSGDVAVLTNIKNTIGSNVATIQLPYKSDITKQCTISSSFSFPANITIDNVYGSGFKINTGVNLTIAGPIHNPAGKQLFYNATAGQGTVLFTGNGSLSEVYASWWGTGGAATTAATAAVSTASSPPTVVQNGGVEITGTATTGYVPTATSSTTATWQLPTVTILSNGSTVGSQPKINFIPGDNVGLVVANNSGASRVDVTISSTGGGGGGCTLANPTALVGLTAVNGSALTCMRSDAAPALDQSITPTWTGAHIFNAAISGNNAINLTGTGVSSVGGQFSAGNNLRLKASASSNFMLLTPSADASVTVTIPAATDTLVNLAGSQALTNKTLTSPVIQGTVSAGSGLTMPTFSMGGAKITSLGQATATGDAVAGGRSIAVSGLGLSGGGDFTSDRVITLTSSSNPGAAASILASTSGGQLTLVNVLATSNVYVRDTSTGLTSPGTTIVAPISGNSIRSTTFTTGLTGWGIDADGNAEFNNGNFRGAIHSSVFVFNELHATAGTLGVFKSACKLRTDATVPASPTYGTTTINIDCVDQDGVSHAASQLFTTNDILRLKDGMSGDTWFKVSSVSDQTTFWRYVSIIQAGSNNVTYRTGAVVADYGQSGQGFIIQTADAANSPYLQMATHAATFSSLDASGSLNVTPQLRVGNLNGSYGFATDIYGFASGQYGVAGKSWVIVDPTNGVRIGNNTTTKIQLDASGNASFAGSITANSGSVGGFDIGSDYVRDAGNSMGLASTVTGGDDVRFWAGATFASRSSAPFRVTEAGALTATNATLTGTLTVSGGGIWMDSAGLGIRSNSSAIVSSQAGFDVSGGFGGKVIEFFNSIPQSVGWLYASQNNSPTTQSGLQLTGAAADTGVTGNVFLRAQGFAGDYAQIRLAARTSNTAQIVFVVSGTSPAFNYFNDTTQVASLTGAGDLSLFMSDAATSTVTDTLVSGHNTSGTVAAGYGSGMLFNLESSTTADRNAARIGALWTDATDASRSSAIVFQTSHSAAALAETFRIASTGIASITGTTATAGRSPDLRMMFSGDNDAALSFLVYDHDNIALAFDAYFNGSSWVSSDAGSNFAIYKTGDELLIGYNAGTAKGSTFSSFDTASGAGFNSAGAMRLGSPTGGYKAAGTLNVSGDIYKNNVAFVNPAWTFHKAFRGDVDRDGVYAPPFAYKGMMALEDHEKFTRANFELPLMFENKGGGLFARGDLVLASLEEAYLYIYELNRRIKALEAKIK